MLSSDIQTIAKVVNGKLASKEVKRFTGFCTDTRSEVKGKIFIALEGPNFDAHSFIKLAEEKGASAIIAHKKIDSNLPIIQVRNCLLYTSPSPRDRGSARMPSSA